MNNLFGIKYFRVTGFGTIGHIIQVNLKEGHLKYKNLIGEILLDNIPTAKTVVAKNDTLGTESKVENKFRILPMELIAGENNFKTVHVEHGNRFELDLEQTYWNSRLQEEHKIMADLIERDSKVVDLCCGIGPFVIPIAKRGFDIIANDLNPGKSPVLESISSRPRLVTYKRWTQRAKLSV